MEGLIAPLKPHNLEEVETRAGSLNRDAKNHRQR